jgi:PAS domain S-box-containing protein
MEILYDKDGQANDIRYLEVNSVFERIADMKDPVGKTLSQMVPNTPRKWLDSFAKVIETGKPNRIIDYSESRKRWYDIYSTRVGGPESRIIAQLFADVTEKRAVEEERQAAMKKVINTLESIGEVFFQLDKDWRIVMVNKLYEGLVKHSRQEMLGKDFWKTFPQYRRSDTEYYRRFHAAMKERKIQHFVDYSPTHSAWFEFRVYPTEEGISIFARDITEHVKAKQQQEEYTQLSVEHDELIRVSKAKDEFIGIASHQLRTPATAVKQYIGIMLAGMAGNLTENQHKFLETAYHSNERQLKLINDLLKTAQIDAAAFTLDRNHQNIASLLTMAMSALEPTLEQRKQRLVFIDESKGAEANVDAVEMDLVFTNLIDNASKYSPANSTITIKVCKKNKALEVSVTDEGVGINQQDQDKIFEKFTRIQNELSSTVSGTGLGLYWVKHIVEMHDGSIVVSSVPGKGSTFTVRLPL